ncbi:MAG: hypothetical protein CMP65_04470 [Flavobacteriales bacterium]|nr:hypothetical protein [Flavobacteriales bacterium]
MKTKLVLLFLGLLTQISAQTDTTLHPFIIGSSGNTLNTNNYNLTFTIGELSIETIYQDEYIFTQGFNQDNYFLTLTEAIESNNTRVSIYPNPTQDILNIRFIDLEGVSSILIRNLNGKLIYSKSNFSTSNELSLDISNFSHGIYFLEITTNSKDVIVYKIQKTK